MHSLPTYVDVSVWQSSSVDEDSNERAIQLAGHIDENKSSAHFLAVSLAIDNTLQCPKPW